MKRGGAAGIEDGEQRTIPVPAVFPIRDRGSIAIFASSLPVPDLAREREKKNKERGKKNKNFISSHTTHTSAAWRLRVSPRHVAVRRLSGEILGAPRGAAGSARSDPGSAPPQSPPLPPPQPARAQIRVRRAAGSAAPTGRAPPHAQLGIGLARSGGAPTAGWSNLYAWSCSGS